MMAVPRVLEKVFQRIDERKKTMKEQWTVWVNFMEIYNESVYDLLEDTHKQNSDSRPVRFMCIHVWVCLCACTRMYIQQERA